MVLCSLNCCGLANKIGIRTHRNEPSFFPRVLPRDFANAFAKIKASFEHDVLFGIVGPIQIATQIDN